MNLKELAINGLLHFLRAVIREESKKTAKDSRDEGMHSFQTAQALLALDLATRADELDPTAQTKTDLACLLIELDRREEAIPYLVQATQLDPKYDRAWLRLAATYQFLDRSDEFIQAAERFLAVSNDLKLKKMISATIQHTQRALAERVADDSTEDYFQSITASGSQRKWDLSQQPVHVYIDQGATNARYQPEYGNIVKQAFREWQTALRDKVVFKFVEEKSAANIQVRWIRDESGEEMKGKDGECKLDFKGMFIANAHISLTLRDVQSARAIHGTALHEIGHALGIKGHSSQINDIMYYCGSGRIMRGAAELSARDVATIQRFYNAGEDESNWLALMNKAITFEKRGRFDLAKECYEKASTLTDNPALRNNFAVMQVAWARDLALGADPKLAEEHFLAATALLRGVQNDIYVDVLDAYAKYLRAQNRVAEAKVIETSKATIERHP